MKYTLAVAALAFLGFAFSQDTANDPAAEAKAGDEARPRIFQRVIPADVLRDFPNFCFASTLCRLFKPEQTWSLQPFCGQSHCKQDNSTGRLFEVVLDCGPKPTNVGQDCVVLNKANETAEFPKCCDVYDTNTCKFPDFSAQAGTNGALPDGGKPVQGGSV